MGIDHLVTFIGEGNLHPKLPTNLTLGHLNLGEHVSNEIVTSVTSSLAKSSPMRL